VLVYLFEVSNFKRIFVLVILNRASGHGIGLMRIARQNYVYIRLGLCVGDNVFGKVSMKIIPAEFKSPGVL
jgi:hypothetical protein